MAETTLWTGVIEGFYGRPWTLMQRKELLSRMRAWGGLNVFVYAPKCDKKHRSAWRTPYEEAEVQMFHELATHANACGIRFVYSIAPGLDIVYSYEEDTKALFRKLAQLVEVGIHHFALLWDDIPPQLSDEDAKVFSSFAEAQCNVTKAAMTFVADRLPGIPSTFIFCPTEYCSDMARPSVSESTYLNTIGTMLPREVLVAWTGRSIISDEITPKEMHELAKILHRKPLLWDNLHANDYDMRRIYLGPFEGRPVELRQEIAGLVSNPNCEYEANFIPIHTLADWARADTYDPQTSFTRALHAWHPILQSPHGKDSISLKELEFLCHIFYLPHRLGEGGDNWLEDTRVLLANKRGTDLSALPEFKRFEAACSLVYSLFRKWSEIENRELAFSLYRFLWEIQEQVVLLYGYVTWLNGGRIREDTLDGSGGCGRGGVFTEMLFHRPKVYWGGLAAEFQRLLPMDPQGGFSVDIKPRVI